MNRIYMCIDLKSFYASVECVERGLDPLNTNLVVADKSRTEKTICLAVSPSLKAYGLGGRCRLFEVNQKVKEINYNRKKENNNKNFTGKSYLDNELKENKTKELDFIAAPPRMALYIKYSSEIYNTYLKYLSPEDIFPYSIDEVFCDITTYMSMYNITPKELVTKIIKDVYDTTGITATAGIGTNMFLAKVAMDIVAKKAKPNEFGVRIAELDEMTYRKLIWNHKPITDIWRVGKGIAKKLNEYGMHTMGDIARMSEKNEDLLYKLFGVNAELLIDHAWGYEPCTMEYVKNYKPENNSISSGQVLHEPTNYKKTKLIVKEMADMLALDLVNKNCATDQIVLTIGYDVDNLRDKNFSGVIKEDYLGRKIPKPAHGTINFDYATNSSKTIMNKVVELFDKIYDKKLSSRRINICACKLIDENKIIDRPRYEQVDIFGNYKIKPKISKKDELEERNVQKTLLNIKNKYGKNSIIKGMNLEDGATAMERNRQIGGHHE